MSTTTRSNIIIPEVLEAALPAQLTGMRCLNGTAAAIVKPGLPADKRGGDVVKVPYFGNVGDMEALAEGVALTPRSMAMSSEQASVVRAGLAVENTYWSENSAADDIHGEAARQIALAAQRHVDGLLIAAATASGLPSGATNDVYNAGTPVNLGYDHVIDAGFTFGDESDDIAAIFMHSKVVGNMLKLKDSTGRPLLQQQNDSMDGKGSGMRFAGFQVVKSDRCPVEFPTITSAGTTPPVVSVTGQTTKAINKLRVEITTAGNRGTAVFRYSFDGGTAWSESGVLTAATYEMKKDGAATGLTLNFATGTAYATDNVYTGTPKYTTIVARRGALAFWYAGAPRVKADEDILTDKNVMAVHLYGAAHRYSRLAGSAYGGVALIKTNG